MTDITSETTAPTPQQPTPAPTPTPETPKTQRPMVLQNQARVEFLDATGAVEEKVMCLRGLTQLVECLEKRLGKDPDEARRQQPVRVTLFKEDLHPNEKDALPPQTEVIEDTLARMHKAMSGNVMSSEEMVVALQRTLERVSEVSDLKCALVTLIVGDEQVGGFGFTSALVKVDEDCMVALAEAGTVQVEVLKEYLRRQNPKVKFAGDKPKKGEIIIPGR